MVITDKINFQLVLQSCSQMRHNSYGIIHKIKIKNAVSQSFRNPPATQFLLEPWQSTKQKIFKCKSYKMLLYTYVDLISVLQLRPLFFVVVVVGCWMLLFLIVVVLLLLLFCCCYKFAY